jgi:hypothetical protein
MADAMLSVREIELLGGGDLMAASEAIVGKAVGGHKRDLLLSSATTALGSISAGKFYRMEQFATAHQAAKLDYLSRLGGIVEEFRAGGLSVAEAKKRFQQLASSSFTSAFKNGAMFSGNPFRAADGDILDSDREYIKRAVKMESGFFDGFLATIQKYPEGVDEDGKRRVMAFDRRTAMYGGALDGIFNDGFITSLPDNTRIRWILSPLCKHCTVCPTMASQVWTPKTLPFTPRSGHTPCLSECKCHLEIIGSSIEGSLPNEPKTTPRSTPAQLFRSDKPLTPADDAKMRELFEAMNRERQLMELTTGEEQAEHIAARKRINAEIIRYMEENTLRITPTYTVGEDLVPAVLDHVKAGYVYLREPELLEAGEAFSAIRNVDVVYGIVDHPVSASASRDRVVAYGMTADQFEVPVNTHIFFVRQDKYDDIVARRAKKEVAGAVSSDEAREAALNTMRRRVEELDGLAESRFDKIIESVAERYDMQSFDVRAVFEECGKVFAEAVIPGRHETQESLRLILETGRVKTQFETGTSEGCLDSRLRAKVEDYFFRYFSDLDPALRPVYGAAKISPLQGRHNVGRGYGDVCLQYKKDRLLGRATVFYGDTLDEYVSSSHIGDELAARVGMLDAPHSAARALAESLYRFFSADATPKSLLERAMRESGRYTEVHVHGGVTLDDIEGVYFFTRPDSDVVATLKSKGKFARLVLSETEYSEL